MTAPAPNEVALTGEVIAPDDESILVVAQLRPMSSDQVVRQFPAGTTLLEIVEAVQPNEVLRRISHAFIFGDRIPQENWHSVRPKPGFHVSITCVPQFGGGKKNPLRFVLMLAVAAASFFVPGLPALAGPLWAGATLTWGSLAGAAIAPLGSLVINAEMPARPNARPVLP